MVPSNPPRATDRRHQIAQALDHCIRKLSRFVDVHHAAPLYECTMTVYRPEAVRGLHPSGAFDKYF